MAFRAWRSAKRLTSLGRFAAVSEPPFVSAGLCLTKSFSTSDHVDAKKQNKSKLANKDWMEKLTSEEFYVTREGGTEAPFSGKYYHHDAEGTYVCICCKNSLFSSKTKFDSGSGWPSFYDIVAESETKHVLERTDTTHGMVRVEVMCAQCDAHLGHVFKDGPPPTGLRYCINSVALDFKPSA